MTTKSPFGVVLSHEGNIEQVGCSAVVTEVLGRRPTGEFDIMTLGVERFRIAEVSSEKSYLEGMVEFFRDSENGDGVEAYSTSTLLDEVFHLCRRLVKSSSKVEAIRDFAGGHSGQASFLLANHLGFDLAFQQRMLEMTDESERLSRMVERLARVVGAESEPAAKGFLEGQTWFHRN